MVLENIYRRDREQSIASYDWTDIADGTGRIKFQGTSSKDYDSDGSNENQEFHLFTQAVRSNPTYTLVTSSGTETLNFDTFEFNLPRIIGGDAFLTAGVAVNRSSSSGYVKVSAQIKLISDTTTNLTSKKYSQKYDSVDGFYKITIPLDISKTRIKKGDKIRLTVELITSEIYEAAIGHDPLNLEWDPDDFTNLSVSVDQDIPRTLNLYLPFDLDL